VEEPKKLTLDQNLKLKLDQKMDKIKKNGNHVLKHSQKMEKGLKKGKFCRRYLTNQTFSYQSTCIGIVELAF